MQAWLANPAVQAGIAPFIAAVVSVALLKRAGGYWAGAAVTAGFAVAVYLSTGFQFQPWTSTRKIVALTLGAAALGVLFDLYPYSRRWLPPLVFALGAAAVLWLVWPVLSRREGLDYWLLAAGAALYAGWCVAALESLRAKPQAMVSAALALGFGTGISALLGASALLGQWGIALGASVSALWLFTVFMRKLALGSQLALPAGLGAALIGCAACVYAKLPWYSLAILATVPLSAQLFWWPRLPRLAQIVISLFAALVPAALAAWFTFKETGAPPL